MNCASCRWAEPRITEDEVAVPVLDCRRFPPQVVIRLEVPTVVWPQVAEQEWCGEYAPAPEVPHAGT